MNNSIDVKKRNIFLSIAVIFLGLLIVGGTYAALMVSRNVDVINGTYQHTLECFDIEYDTGSDIRGMLFPSRTPSGGLSGDLSIKINDSCSVLGIGDLKLTVDSNSDEVFIQTVDAHCEDPTTLETLTNYSTESSCILYGGEWISSGTALKYAVYTGTDTTPISVGYINSIGSAINIYGGFNVSNDLQQYTVAVWLDGNLADNTYQNLSFSGQISATVTQTATSADSDVYYIQYANGTPSLNAPTSAQYDEVITIGEPDAQATGDTINFVNNASTYYTFTTTNSPVYHEFSGWTFDGHTSMAMYGEFEYSVTNSWDSNSTLVTGPYFKNLTSLGNTVTLTANYSPMYSFDTPSLLGVMPTGVSCYWASSSTSTVSVCSISNNSIGFDCSTGSLYSGTLYLNCSSSGSSGGVTS